ncbi:hypothetical protein GCM10023260_10260 [Bartonella acomydis]|uniref:Uncharacterized protein n=1 Tax=Bartonella acomydis TaxID=686234 RepID=A0ABP9MN93_9HYPH
MLLDLITVEESFFFTRTVLAIVMKELKTKKMCSIGNNDGTGADKKFYNPYYAE